MNIRDDRARKIFDGVKGAVKLLAEHAGRLEERAPDSGGDLAPRLERFAGEVAIDVDGRRIRLSDTLLARVIPTFVDLGFDQELIDFGWRDGAYRFRVQRGGEVVSVGVVPERLRWLDDVLELTGSTFSPVFEASPVRTWLIARFLGVFGGTGFAARRFFSQGSERRRLERPHGHLASARRNLPEGPHGLRGEPRCVTDSRRRDVRARRHRAVDPPRWHRSSVHRRGHVASVAAAGVTRGRFSVVSKSSVETSVCPAGSHVAPPWSAARHERICIMSDAIDTSKHICTGWTSDPCDCPPTRSVDFGHEVFVFCERCYVLCDRRSRRTCGKSLQRLAALNRLKVN